MNRRSDANLLVAGFDRVRAAWRHLVQRQFPFSAVTAALAGMLTLVFAVDLAFGHRGSDRYALLSWCLAFLALAALPLIFGRTYPKWAGFVTVVFLNLWILVFAGNEHHAHWELNAFLQFPLMALYAGWFFTRWVARSMLGMTILVTAFTVLRHNDPSAHHFSSVIGVLYSTIFGIFFLEASSLLQQRAQRQARLDPLTGVLNRRGMMELARPLIARAHRSRTPLSIVVVDFDDFKAVNDQGGHAAGDAALRETARTWMDGVAPRDLVARLGGDEFALLIHGTSDVANDLMRCMSADARYAWSWGIAQLREGDGLEDLLRRADVRMYHAKGHDDAFRDGSEVAD